MALSDVEICNLALNAIGHTKFIEALVGEDSDEADACNVQYAPCRDELLELIEWPFNTRRSRPAAITATTLEFGEMVDEWTYAYLLPADCLPNGLRRISQGSRNLLPDDEPKYVIEYDGALEKPIVLTDEQNPEFVYSARIEDSTLYAPTFARALAERIAIELIRGLRKDPKLLPLQAAAYQSAINRAIASAKKSQRKDNEPLPAHIAGR